jgi:hypothetical protein
MDLLLIFGVPLAAGFAAGYSFRAHISRRRQELFQLHSPWHMPRPRGQTNAVEVHIMDEST